MTGNIIDQALDRLRSTGWSRRPRNGKQRCMLLAIIAVWNDHVAESFHTIEIVMEKAARQLDEVISR